jgi:hypothetical protein
MKYLLINTNIYNGTQIGVNIFYASPIKSGEHIGKYATSENALTEFPDIFKNITYEIVELPISAFELDYTLPTPSPYGLEILEKWYDIFPDNAFKLGGYEIPLEEKNGIKYVNAAYFQWQDFRNALDEKLPNGEFRHQALKDALMKMWDYLTEQATIGNVIVL